MNADAVMVYRIKGVTEEGLCEIVATFCDDPSFSLSLFVPPATVESGDGYAVLIVEVYGIDVASLRAHMQDRLVSNNGAVMLQILDPKYGFVARAQKRLSAWASTPRGCSVDDVRTLFRNKAN